MCGSVIDQGINQNNTPLFGALGGIIGRPISHRRSYYVAAPHCDFEFVESTTAIHCVVVSLHDEFYHELAQ